jgi:3-phenylpropionate/cinnamic acid dioxygenase small subunit
MGEMPAQVEKNAAYTVQSYLPAQSRYARRQQTSKILGTSRGGTDRERIFCISYHTPYRL